MAGIAAGIFDEVFLMVIFRRVEFCRGRNLGGNRPVELTGLVPLRCHAFRGLLLCLAGVENGRAILRAHVVVLAVQCRGIVHAKEIIQQRLVTEPGGIEHHFNRLRMASAAGANLFIGRVCGFAAAIAHGRFDDARDLANESPPFPKSNRPRGSPFHGSGL